MARLHGAAQLLYGDAKHAGDGFAVNHSRHP